ncbi:MAG TPA: flagellar basal body rod C-terminal domain-containing protein [Roseomonas sp.]|jgi:flagellar hook-associated protein 1 FlgK
MSSLDSILATAQSGLRYAQRAVSTGADNVANAQTAGDTRKSVASIASGYGAGVRTGLVTRDVDNAIIDQLNRSGGTLAGATARESLLTTIEMAHGQTSGGDGIGDLVSSLRTAFVQMQGDPSAPGYQNSAVLAAGTLTDRFHAVAGAIVTTRQQTQDGIEQEVKAANAAITRISTLTQQIQAQRAAGASTADLDDARDQAIAGLSEGIPVKALRSADGGIALVTQGGQSITIPSKGDPFSTTGATIGPASYYGSGGTIPPVTLYGIDVTTQIQGGRLGEYVNLRDTTLPRYQAEVDLSAATIADRFDGQGLRLFTNGAGTVPDPTQPYAGSAVLGFAATMVVNPAVQANPALLRDGTHAVAGSPTGASAFTPNGAGGPAGFATLLGRVVDFSFGTQAQNGVGWPPIPTSGLGPDGTLSSPFIAPKTIEAYAANVTATQTGDRAAATAAVEDAATVNDGLNARFSERSSVDVDQEMANMVTLQNAYAANARVISTVQAMWDTLLQVGR